MNLIHSSGPAGLAAVNAFAVRPDNQQALVDCIRAANDRADLPGLLAMHLLRSLDGTQVINHMLWADDATFRAATAGDPVIAETKHRVHTLIEGTGPVRYEIIPVHPG
jgi:heme-degrading monooxygenase HmoA